MRRLSGGAVVAIVWVALGCGQESSEEPVDSEAPAQVPEAVTPAEVAPPRTRAEAGEVSRLRARVDALEARLAQCGCELPDGPDEGRRESGSAGPRTVAIPETVPEGVDLPEAAEGSGGTSRREEGPRAGRPGNDTRTRERAERRPAPAEPPPDPRRDRRLQEHETLELPNPASWLLGE